MSRRFTFVLFLLLLVLLTGFACADQISGDYRYRVTEDNEAVITAVSDPKGFQGSVLEIPDHLGGYPVVGIDRRAFKGDEIETLILPDSLRFIGDAAFSNCGSLKEVRFPPGLERIGEYAFFRCKALASVAFPDSLVSIGADAFGECALTELSLPASVEEIGNYAFGWNDLSGCDLVLPDHLTRFGSNAFSRVASVTIPSSVTDLPTDFIPDPGRVIIAEGHPTLRLEDDMWLISHTETGDRLIRILRIEDHSYEDILSIPDTVTVVSEGAFSSFGWTGFVIPASLVSFEGEYSPFSSSQSITVAEGNPRYRVVDNLLIDTETATLLCFCAGDEAPARLVLPDGIRAIAGGAFEGRSPAEVVVPEGVTWIGERAFASGDLETLVLPSTISGCGGEILNSYHSVTVEVAPGAWNLRFFSRYSFNPEEGEIPSPLRMYKSGKSYILYYLYTDGS